MSGWPLGPLLEGEHTFEILLGGVVVGEAKAVVRAGRLTPLPVGAHAAVADCRLLTREAKRYREYFPELETIAP